MSVNVRGRVGVCGCVGVFGSLAEGRGGGRSGNSKSIYTSFCMYMQWLPTSLRVFTYL